ncbi:MAG: DNA repair protein RadA [Candidatus Kapaibacterium sp.]|nr:MAG: DNA repair protein RadA [Candidatus Kapabacteria bacterium]
MKSRSVFVCQECGYRALKWLGKCPSCGAWGALVEEIEHAAPAAKSAAGVEPVALVGDRDVRIERICSGITEFDRVMGGGIVPGSVTVIGGDPGVGKSTLMLQLCAAFSARAPLYVSGEESLEQLRHRAHRLGIRADGIAVLTEQAIEDVVATIEATQPGLVVIDSIQTLYGRELESLPGSIGQVRYCTAQLVQLAKQRGIPILLVGHVTKEGMLAGPKVLEHMVDVVVQFEGEGNYAYRILRAVKNRYGSTNEIGVFEMRSSGIAEVANPSELFLTQRTTPEPGTAVTALFEGSRSLLVEVQALVMQSSYSVPQRVANGYDGRRLQMLLAVLERRIGFDFLHCDVFVNIAGGIAVRDPGADLAVCTALVSSLRNSPSEDRSVVIGEVGLTSELRQVMGMEIRLKEAEKLGFTLAVTPPTTTQLSLATLQHVQARTITDALMVVLR